MHTNLISSGDVISICHYSGINPFKSVVMDINSDAVKVKLIKGLASMNFNKGDPAVFGIESRGEVKVFGSDISAINTKEDIVVLNVDKDQPDSDRRQCERYPVSLYSDLVIRDSRKKHLAIIKDMSYHGMKIYTKEDTDIQQQVELNIYMDKSMMFLKANIMRKVKSADYIEYGLGIVYEDTSSLNTMKEYMKRLQLEQEESIRKLRR
jgi:hypothetical protein